MARIVPTTPASAKQRARTPSIPKADYQKLVRFLADEGYDTGKVQLVPLQWPAIAGHPAITSE